jgi:hypothetical protein
VKELLDSGVGFSLLDSGVGFSTTASGLAELCNKAPLEMGGCAKRRNALSIGGVI